jgi:hypothetical protein
MMFRRACHIFLGILGVLVLGYLSLFLIDGSAVPVRYGVSFDPDYARYILVDAGKAYMTLLNEWKFRLIRLPVHWDVVEWQRGKFTFEDIDWYISRASDVDAKIILAIGQKTPRWPECHIPKWAKELNEEEYQKELRNYITTVIERYKNNPAVEVWQVENEPFLRFGECHTFTSGQQLKDEIVYVKKSDPSRKTLVSDSGELSTWARTATAADYFGTTVYRTVWDKMFGYVTYRFVPAGLYRFRAMLWGRDVGTAWVTELQAEPWIMGVPLSEVPLEEQAKSMSLGQLRENIAYAERIGFPRVYLWGAEWWYWLEEQGIKDVSEYIKTLPK